MKLILALILISSQSMAGEPNDSQIRGRRFQLVNIGKGADQFMIDTDTGKVWQLICGYKKVIGEGDCITFLKRVDAEGLGK